MKQNLMKMTAILFIFVSVGMLLVFSGCTDPEIPWWKDYENLQFVFEDERSEEKSLSCPRYYNGKIEFNYIYQSTNKEEYIPKGKILHKGVEKKSCTYVYKREEFPFNLDGFIYNEPQFCNVVKDYGGFRVTMYFFLNEEDLEKFQNQISIQQLYIIVHKGEEL